MDFLINAMHRGGPYMWPLLACASWAILIATTRLWVLHRAAANGRALYAAVAEAIEDDDLDLAAELCRVRPHAALSRVLGEIIDEARLGVTHLTPITDSAIVGQHARLRRGAAYLPMLASVAMLLGILGTINGLVMGFSCM